jgi:hypothetical protein
VSRRRYLGLLKARNPGRAVRIDWDDQDHEAGDLMTRDKDF